MKIAVIPDHIKDPERYVIRENYLSVLEKYGVIPIITTYTEASVDAYLDLCHGLMIIGGGFTIDPSLFGQEKQTPLETKPQRTQAEWSFFQKAFQQKMPILGICGGAQLMNVALGGTLIQHLPTMKPTALSHSAPDATVPAHAITIDPDSLLYRIAGIPTTDVNSSHVQAIDQLGQNLKISAYAPDGVIEAIESTDHPFCLGVQWHPEYEASPACDPLIFQAFIAACKDYALATPQTFYPS